MIFTFLFISYLHLYIHGLDFDQSSVFVTEGFYLEGREFRLQLSLHHGDIHLLYRGCVVDKAENVAAVFALFEGGAIHVARNAYAIGKTGKEIDKVARDIINGAGYEGCFGHGLGHGVGMDIHEAPGVNAGASTPFCAGHVVTCEPGIYLEGKFGVRIEDMVVFGENGPYDITLAPKELIIL